MKSLKSLFIEEVEDTKVPEDIATIEDVITEEEKELVEGVTTVSEIYEKHLITDLSRSIFKVEEIEAVIPDELSSDVKKKTVIGMLGISGLTVEGLLEDANKRTQILFNTRDAMEATTTENVANREAKVAELEAEIDAVKSEINQLKTEQEYHEKAINAEVTRIDNIVKFIK